MASPSRSTADNHVATAIVRRGGQIGPTGTEGLISAVLASRPHPEQGFPLPWHSALYASLQPHPGALEAVGQRAVELALQRTSRSSP